MIESIPVYMDQDPYLTQVLNQLVTRAGQFYTLNAARYDIVSGRVSVDGEVIRYPGTILEPGVYTVQVGPNSYQVELNHSVYE